MAGVMNPSDLHEDLHSIAPSDSDVDSLSLCGSDLEVEMAWGEGPIAPLRTDAESPVAPDQTRPKNNGNGSGRAKTPQKRDPSPLQKSKRLINIHPVRSPGYLVKPNELPIGGRKQQRWFNDHHFGNKAASTRLEDLMEHMTINVDWRSNFQKLAEPDNRELQTAFRKGRIQSSEQTHQPKYHRKDDWDEAETNFARIDRRARHLIVRSFKTFEEYIEAIEYCVLHFIQWREVPSEVEVSEGLQRYLVQPMEIGTFGGNDVHLCLPLVDSAFHRLIVHSVCQFYGVRSRTEANRRFNTKIMVLKAPKVKFTQEQLANLSFSEFVRETRLNRNVAKASSSQVPMTDDPLEDLTKSSECSDGYTLMDYPQV